MRKHINASTAKTRQKGLEGADPGTSASLIYTDHKGRTIEGRQSYPVKVYADGKYVGILNPGETIDTFAASRIDEIPTYGGAGFVEATKEKIDDVKDIYDDFTNPSYSNDKVNIKGTLNPEVDLGWDPSGGLTRWGSPTVNLGLSGGIKGEYKVNPNLSLGADLNWGTKQTPNYTAGLTYRFQDGSRVGFPFMPVVGAQQYADEVKHLVAYNEGGWKAYLQSKGSSYYRAYNMLTKPNLDSKGSYDKAFAYAQKNLPKGSTFMYEGQAYKNLRADEYPDEMTKIFFEKTIFEDPRFKDHPERADDLKDLWIRAGQPPVWTDPNERYYTFAPPDARAHIRPVSFGGVKNVIDLGGREKAGREKAIVTDFVDELAHLIHAHKDDNPYAHGAIYQSLDYLENELAYTVRAGTFNYLKDKFDGPEISLLPNYTAIINSYIPRTTTKKDADAYNKKHDAQTKKLIEAYKNNPNQENYLNLYNHNKNWNKNLGTEGGTTSPKKDKTFMDYLTDAQGDTYSLNYGKEYFDKQTGRTHREIKNPDLHKQYQFEEAYHMNAPMINPYTHEPVTYNGEVVRGSDAAIWAYLGFNPRDRTLKYYNKNTEGAGRGVGNYASGSPERVNYYKIRNWKLDHTTNESAQNNYKKNREKFEKDRKAGTLPLQDLNKYPANSKERAEAYVANNYGLFTFDKNNNQILDESINPKHYHLFKNLPTYKHQFNDILKRANKELSFRGTTKNLNLDNINIQDFRGNANLPTYMFQDKDDVKLLYKKGGSVLNYQDGTNVQIQEPTVDIETTKKEQTKIKGNLKTKDEEYIDFINTRKPYKDEYTVGDDPELYFLDYFNTSLTADELIKYYIWKNELAERRAIISGTNIEDELKRLDMDQGTYDIQGFWKSGDYRNTDTDGHGTDRWKKPNHPSFSNESIYANNYKLQDGEEDHRSIYEGGEWLDNGGFMPGVHNMYDNASLHRRFGEEPNRKEHLYMGNPIVMNSLLQKNPLLDLTFSDQINPFNNETVPMDEKRIKYLDSLWYSYPDTLRMQIRNDINQTLNSNITDSTFTLPKIPSDAKSETKEYQDGSTVESDTIPYTIVSPLTEEATNKYAHMYRERTENDLADLTFDLSTEEGLLNYLKRTENSYGAGYKRDAEGNMKWFPHDDGKGNMTIGYGHNIHDNEDYSQGISTDKVMELLKNDIKEQRALLKKGIKFWDNLSPLEQNALLDIQFNIKGNVWTKFPKFTEAIRTKDYETLILEGSREELTGPTERNAAFYKSAIEPLVKDYNKPRLNPLHPDYPLRQIPAVRDNTNVGTNTFGGWEYGSHVKKYQDGTDVENEGPQLTLRKPGLNPLHQVSTEPLFATTNPQSNAQTYLNIYPNYSDPTVYKYYLEGDTTMIPFVNVESDEHVDELKPVPFFSTNLATGIETPNLWRPTGTKCIGAQGQIVKQCSSGLQLALAYNTPLSKRAIQDVNGIKGDAWHMHSNVVDAGGMSLFNYSDYLPYEEYRNNPISSNDLYERYNIVRDYGMSPNEDGTLTNRFREQEKTLQVGDLVDLYYQGSDYQAEAQTNGKGSNVNTHVGKITEKDGVLYVTHNILGTWFSDPLEEVLNNQKTSYANKNMMIVGAVRPKYSSGLVPGVSFNNDERTNQRLQGNIIHEGWNSEDSMNYINHLGLTLPFIQDDFGLSNDEASLVARASYGTLAQESSFGEGDRYTAKSYTRDLLRAYKYLDETMPFLYHLPLNSSGNTLSKYLGMDDLSEGLTQIKYRQWKNDPVFQNYGINDPEILYTSQGASRSTALIHSINLEFLNSYFAGNDLPEDVKLNMLHLAYNKGVGNVIKDFIDEDKNMITPSSFEKGLNIYKERHNDPTSYTFNPYNASKLVDFDIDVLRGERDRIDGYTTETMSAFETMWKDVMSLYNEHGLDPVAERYNSWEERKLQNIAELINRANEKKDPTMLKKAKNKLEKFNKRVMDKYNKEHTRFVSKVRDEVKDVSGRVKDKVNEIKEDATEVVKKGKYHFDNHVDEFNIKYQSTKQKVEDKTKEKIKEVKTEVKDILKRAGYED